MSGGTSWEVVRSAGPAAPVHARPLPVPARRTIWVHEVERPALVLGSGQDERIVDEAAVRAAGAEVVRRRSGGGAVLLVPGSSWWVDVVLPAADPLWDDDVVRAAGWVGRTWAAALARQGVAAEVHDGRLEAGPWGALVCFAGVGPGEVCVGGRKVVGLSQRRTRRAARFQCVADPTWRGDELLALLDLAVGERDVAAAALAPPAGWVPPEVDGSHLVEDLVALLPA